MHSTAYSIRTLLVTQTNRQNRYDRQYRRVFSETGPLAAQASFLNYLMLYRF
jgi:hypothetical protein